MSSRTVAHFKGRYLPLTETFIYQYLTNHQRYDTVMVGIQAANLNKFPYQPRYLLFERPLWDPRFWLWGFLQKFDISSINLSYYGHVIKQTDPDILHAHFGPTGVQLVPYRESDRPLVTSFYGYDASKLVHDDESVKADYERLFETGDLILVEGPAMQEKLLELGCPESKLSIQRIAIDTSRIEPRYPDAEGGLTVLIVGRYVEKKGIPDGIRAFAEAFRDRPDAELRIVGGEAGEITQSELEAIAAEEGIREQVTFAGYLDYDDYLAEVHSCDILLAPSKRASSGDSEGGAPTVLLEAQASGKPVVSTTHADIPYVVADDETGKLVTPGNVAELADALRWCTENRDKLTSMGKSGQARMKSRHDVDALVGELEAEYDKLVN